MFSWKRWVRWVPTFVVVLSVWILLEFLMPNPASLIKIPYPNILIAISQACAGILGIMFTMLLLVGQLAAQHSSRMFPRVFTKLSIGYMTLFLILVIFPFVTLTISDNIDETLFYRMLLVKSSILLAVFSLSLFIPYLLYLKEQVNPERLLDDLAKSSRRRMEKLAVERRSESELSVAPEVNLVQHLVINAIRHEDYASCRKGIEVLGKLCYQAPATIMVKEYNLSLPDFIKLKILDALIIAVSGANENPAVFSETLKALRAVTAQGAISYSVFVLRKINGEVLGKGQEKSVIEVAYSLGFFGDAAIDALMEKEIKEAIAGLRHLLSDLLEVRQGWNAAIKQCIEALGYIGKRASEKTMGAIDVSAKRLLSGIVRRVIIELADTWDKSAKSQKYEVAHVAAYRITTVCEMSIKAGRKSETWPKEAVRLAINKLSRIAGDETKRGDVGKEALSNACKALHRLGLEALDSAQEEIAVHVFRRLKEVQTTIVAFPGNERVVDAMDYYLRTLRARAMKLGWDGIAFSIQE